jgi:formylglycine-generating enzyme required for sulfatase activity
VTYDVYFEAGDPTPDVLISYDQSSLTYDPGTLTVGTSYYWRIVAKDEHDATTVGPVWNFLTAGTAPSNNPPNTPTTPSPADNATGQSLTTALTWTGGDPDGDSVTYDVYFEANDATPDVLVSNDQPGATYAPGTLSASTHYYWQIVTQDEHGLTTPGPVWNFTTGAGGGVIPGEMVLIPAGTFQMGCDPAHNGGYGSVYGCYYEEELPLHPVYLDAYRIDKYEVTNAQYAQCVAAGHCTAPWSNSSGSRPSYYDSPTYAAYPVIHVDWNQAVAYCAWAGQRLPSEAEWEKAARGGSDTRAYPWGDGVPNCTLANGYYSGGYCVGDTSAVGSYPPGASPYSVMDMGGNVFEWVNDWYDGSYYSASPAGNPPGPAAGSYKVLRGGSWANVGYYTRAFYRDRASPDFRIGFIGFRCVGGAAP